jgi:hypothetical protein
MEIKMNDYMFTFKEFGKCDVYQNGELIEENVDVRDESKMLEYVGIKYINKED